jgi:hypothetical protein
MTPKVLVVLTSHDKLGSTGHPTGWYLVCNPTASIKHSTYLHPILKIKGKPIPQ